MNRLFFNKATYRSYGLTDKGCVRDQNEDSFLEVSDTNLWVVADGAGGHDAGEVASQLIVDRLSTIKKYFFRANLNEAIKQRLEEVNTDLIALSGGEKTPSLIASTVCVLTIEGSVAHFFWSGDSRIYLLRNKQLIQLSKDHNRLNEYIDAGFSPQEAKRIPQAWHLTAAIGVSSPLYMEEKSCQIETGDLFLLCSDGLFNELSIEEIQSFLLHGSVEVMSHNLMNKALSRGAKDNVTVLLVSC